MPVTRFEEILMYIHFVDKYTQRLEMLLYIDLVLKLQNQKTLHIVLENTYKI